MSLPPFKERFLGQICAFSYLLYLAFIFQIMLLLLNLLSFFTVELPPETLAIVHLNFLLLGITLSMTIVLIYACNRHQSGKKLLGPIPSRNSGSED